MKELFNSDLFEKLRNSYICGKLKPENNVINGNINTPENVVEKYPEKIEDMEKYSAAGIEAIKNGEFAVTIVNGGMATRFGNKVKGIVEVFDDKSFLEIKIDNIKNISEKTGGKIYVFVMNSVFTDEQTRLHFEENDYFGYDKKYIIFFNQYYFKRILRDGKIDNGSIQPLYGSGHGDFYYAFKEFIIPKIKNENIKYILYSNVDNLGAYIDPVILGYHINREKKITVELAQKYPDDKGGAPAIVDGKPQIVEEFKFPRSFNQADISSFNTATYIFSKSIFDSEVELPFYVVEKQNENRENVIQFERLTGDLTVFFDANYLLIDREKRFHPIKTQEDLINRRNVLKKLYSCFF